MSWIESHQSLSRHRKTLRAATLLKVPRVTMIGYLHELWWWGLDNADIDGKLNDISEAEIAAGATWPEKGAPAFVDALVHAGFLDSSEGRYSLHNWYKYAGKLNVRRESDRERQKIRRASSGQSAGQPEEIGPSSEGTVPNRTNLTVPNLTEGSIDPSPAVKEEKPLPLPKKTSPTATWKEQMRAEYGDRIDFETRWRFHTNSAYYAKKPDKCQFLVDAFEADVKWAAEHRTGPNARPSQPAAPPDDDWMAKYNPVEFPG